MVDEDRRPRQACPRAPPKQQSADDRFLEAVNNMTQGNGSADLAANWPGAGLHAEPRASATREAAGKSELSQDH
jgi:hypothetical protein